MASVSGHTALSYHESVVPQDRVPLEGGLSEKKAGGRGHGRGLAVGERRLKAEEFRKED